MQRPSLTLSLRLLSLALALALTGFRCSSETADVAPLAAPPKADLRLLLLTDPRGYLEPCGCQKRMLGGVDKLSAALKEARAEGVPSLMLAAGNLTSGAHLSAEDKDAGKTEELWRRETLIDVWNDVGLAAATPGALDLDHGMEAVTSLAKQAKFAWIADNVSISEKPLEGLTEARIVNAGPFQVGVMGLVAPHPAHPIPKELALNLDLRAIAKKTSAKLRAQGARIVIALLSGDRRAAREVSVEGVDLVVLGGLDQLEPMPPAPLGSSVVLHAGREGQRLLVVDLELDGQGPFHDESAWTFEHEKKDLEARAKDLEAKIKEWASDPKVKAAELEAQKQRLASMKSELQKKRAPKYEGRWLSARIVDLAPEIKGDPKITAKMDAFDKRVNEHNRVALSHVVPKQAPEGSAVYAGSESCKSCHQAAYEWWRSTKHGQAYKTLEDVHKEFSLACVGCHVTGYNQPGGSTVTHVENLKDVGCENCHGPGSKHNAAPEEKGLVKRDTPEAVCKSCHNAEHSARFVYDGFRSLLIVPGHGLPLPAHDPGTK